MENKILGGIFQVLALTFLLGFVLISCFESLSIPILFV